jgi:hypothetical protein
MAAHARDLEFQSTIVEQQNVAADHVFGQILVVEADAFLIAERTLRIENEGFADDQRDLAALELADPDFRPLQVAEDADSAAMLGSGSRMPSARALWSSAVPCEKFIRTTSMPACTMRSRMSGDDEAGPSVATILVWRNMSSPSLFLFGFWLFPVDRSSDTTVDVLRDYFAARSSSTAMAGRVLPSRNSRKAPPPVEM